MLTESQKRACRKVFQDYEKNLLDENEALEECNQILNGYGIEYVTTPDGTEIAYVNMGDTYDETVVWYDDGWFEFGSWGGILEEYESEYEEEEGVVRCGYCSEYTEIPEGLDWDEVICESCGRNVQTGEYPKTVFGRDQDW